MAYLTKLKVKEILDQAPPEFDKGEIVKSLIKQGHQLEGLSEQSQARQQEEPQQEEQRQGGALNTAADVAEGFGKGVINTVKGIANTGGAILKKFNPLAEKASKAFGGSGKVEGYQDIVPEALVTPENTAQKVGFYSEKIAETFLPTKPLAAVGRAIEGASAATKAPKFVQAAMNLAGRSGLEAGAAYGQTKLQGGSDEEAKRNAVIAGAIPPVFKLISSATKPLVTKIGQKIQTSVIKPQAVDMKDGFKIENVNKYRIGGSLEKMATQAHERITKLTDKLKQIESANPAEIDVLDVLAKTEKELATDTAKNFGANSKLKKAFETLFDELSSVSPTGRTTFAEAQQIKRGAGKLGAWQFGNRDPESTALEKAANAFYTNMRQTLEKAATKEFSDINKALNELIPIENAIVRRIPVAQRNNVLSLGDMVSVAGGPGNWWLFVLNRLTKSGTVGSALVKAGETTERGTLGTRLLGSGRKNVSPQPLNIPELNVGLSIKNVSDPKLMNLRMEWNRIQKAKLNTTDKTAIRRYEKALQAIQKQVENLR